MTHTIEAEIWKADDKRLRESEFGKLLKDRGTTVRTCTDCGSVYDEDKGCTCKERP